MSHFDRDSIVSYLADEPELFRHLTVVEEAGSTNEDLKALAMQGAPEWSIIAAASQTAGKGSRGRSWSSPKGSSLAFSILLRPKITPEKASAVTLVMALAVAEGLERVVDISYDSSDELLVDISSSHVDRPVVDITSGYDAGRAVNITQKFEIKWPNDIVRNKKKICGILTEMPAYTPDSCCIIVGAGINVNMDAFPEELQDKATSLKLEFGREFDRAKVFSEVLRCFRDRYQIFLKTADLSALREEYEKRLINRGEKVRLLEKDGEITGTGLGINDKGELLVNVNGALKSVRAGEVSVRGLYTYA